jgi:hypothetical protein
MKMRLKLFKRNKKRKALMMITVKVEMKATHQMKKMKI